MNLQNYRPVVAGTIAAGALAVVAMPSLAYGQVKNNPVFVTIEQVEEIVAEAVVGVGDSLGDLVSRMDANEAADTERDGAIAALEQQLSEQELLMASQSAELVALNQALAGHETRLGQLESVSHEKTPLGETMFLNGNLFSGHESFVVDLTEYDVATFRIEAIAGMGRFIVYRNDGQFGWLPVKIMESDAVSSPRTNYTMLLEDGDYKVVVDHSAGFLGNFSAVHY